MTIAEAVPQLIDNVELRIHEVATLREQFPQWGSLSDREKLRLAQQTEPVAEHSTHNVTCIGFHEYVISNLDPDEPVNEDITHLALGDVDTPPEVQNESLNNEVFRTTITDVVNNGNDLLCSTFLNSGMANGHDLREAALINTDDTDNYILFNHSLVDDPEGRLQPKTDEITATLNVTIRARDGT